MFQDFALFPHLTIQQNVAFGLPSLTCSEANSEALAALTRVGLARTSSPGASSSAWRSPAPSPRARACFMDEPFSGLDPRLRDL
jgi:iron(III) transport system ATP-binding protein